MNFLQKTAKEFLKEVVQEFITRATITAAEEGTKTYFFYVKKKIEEGFKPVVDEVCTDSTNSEE